MAVARAGFIMGGEELPEQEYECPKHGKYRGRPVKLKFVENPIDPGCPECGAETRAFKAAEKEKRKAAEQEERRIGRLTALNIRRKFWNESFETFYPYTEELKHHLQVCREFAGKPEGRMLVMLGNNGNGKNHLAASILKITGGVKYTVYEIELLMKQSFSGETREWEFVQRLCEVEMLVIDEIGRTKGGDWELNWLSHVINRRYEDLLPTVLMSNKHRKESCPRGETGCPDCIQNWVGNDILSRIIENGVILNFTGEDYRRLIREKIRDAGQGSEKNRSK
jgi:DNA replication protein DnaC